MHSLCETCVDVFCPFRNQYSNCPKTPHVVTTTTKGSNSQWVAAPSIETGKNIYETLYMKASRLAESVLMDWNKEQQVELAKEVASIVNLLLPKGE